MPTPSPTKALELINKTLTSAEAKTGMLIGLIASPGKGWLNDEVKTDVLSRLRQIKTLADNAINMLDATPIPLGKPALVTESVSNGRPAVANQTVQEVAPIAEAS